MGLTAADFTVLEGGKPQRIVSVSPVDVGERDPAPFCVDAVRHCDVAANDLADQLGDGRLFAIVIDDMNLPADDADMLLSAREAARHVLDSLGPSRLRGRRVCAGCGARPRTSRTTTRNLLRRSIVLQPHPLFTIDPLPLGPGPAGGDMAERFSTTLADRPVSGMSPSFQSSTR